MKQQLKNTMIVVAIPVIRSSTDIAFSVSSAPLLSFAVLRGSVQVCSTVQQSWVHQALTTVWRQHLQDVTQPAVTVQSILRLVTAEVTEITKK